MKESKNQQKVASGQEFSRTDINTIPQRLGEQQVPRSSHLIYLAKLAHDLKAPLCSLKGLLHIAVIDVEDDDALRYLNLIGQHQQFLYTRINGLLNKLNLSENDDPLQPNLALRRVKVSWNNLNILSKTRFLVQSKGIVFSKSADQEKKSDIILRPLVRHKNSQDFSSSGDLPILIRDVITRLNSIKIILENALDQIESETARNYFEFIEKSCKLLYARIEGVLNGIQGNYKANESRIDFNDIIGEINNTMKHMEGFSDIRFRVIVEDLNPFFSDADAIYSIIQNLVENAVKYRKRENCCNEVVLRVTGFMDGIVINVSDNGIGIKEELANDVFKFGVRDKNTTQDGHGIGLSLVMHLTEQLGGQILVDSKAGQGTAFRVKIPNSPTSDTDLNKMD